MLSTAALAGESATQAHDLVSRFSKVDEPGLISYQGALTDSGSVSLNTIVSVTFSLYTDSTGGTQVWTETQPLIEVNDGRFNVLLGRVNAIPDTVFQDPERWLGIRVESDSGLESRQRMAVEMSIPIRFTKLTETQCFTLKDIALMWEKMLEQTTQIFFQLSWDIELVIIAVRATAQL
jgi:hypothetical protein